MNEQTLDTHPTQEEVIAMLESGELITRYEKLIYKIVHKLLKAHPNENFDELLSEAYWGIMVQAPRYDPKRSSLTSWVFRASYFTAKTYCINPKTHRNIPTEVEDPVFDRAEPESWLTSFLRGLGEDAEFLITAILEAPGELGNVIRNSPPRESRRTLKKHMKKTWGWTLPRWESAWNEIKANL